MNPNVNTNASPNIYIHGFFTEKPYTKSFERKLVYIPVIPVTLNDVKITHGCLQSDWVSAML